MSNMTEIGHIQPVSDGTAAALVGTDGTLTQAAVDARVVPAVADALSDPSTTTIVTDAAALAVTADIAGRDLVDGDDPRVGIAEPADAEEVRNQHGQTVHRIDNTGVTSGNSRENITATDEQAWDMSNGTRAAEINNKGEFWIYDAHFGSRAMIRPTVTDVHVAIVAGQSINSGRGLPISATLDPIDSRIWQYGSGRIEITPATVPLLQHDTPTGLSPATVFAREYLRTLPVGHVVLLVPAAHGDTALTVDAVNGVWQYGYTGAHTPLAALMLAQTQRAIAQAGLVWPRATVTTDVFLWAQGEADAAAAVTEAAYAAGLDALIGGVRTTLGLPALPVVVSGMVEEWVAASAAARTPVKYALLNTPKRLDRTAYAPGPIDASNYNDLVHYARAGVERLGRAMFTAYTDRARIDWTGSRPVPPHDVRALRDGTTVTVTWALPSCAMDAFVVETSPDGATWTVQTRVTALEPRQIVPGAGARCYVRVSTVRSTYTSTPSTPILAIGA